MGVVPSVPSFEITVTGAVWIGGVHTRLTGTAWSGLQWVLATIATTAAKAETYQPTQPVMLSHLSEK